jgi:3-oxoacyl-[acyl-carrier-protein] synthase-3
MARCGLGTGEIDAIIVATITPDMLFPATACLIQDQLGLTGTWGFDLSAACSGFLYGLTAGAQLVASGAHQRVVVVGADLMSSIIDSLDRTTAVLFGDGAGAVLLEAGQAERGIIDFYHRVDGSGRNDLLMPAGGSLLPPSAATVAARQHYLKQNGKVVFKFAISQMVESVQILLQRHGLTQLTSQRWYPIKPINGFWMPSPSGLGCRKSGWFRCWPATATPPERRCLSHWTQR